MWLHTKFKQINLFLFSFYTNQMGKSIHMYKVTNTPFVLTQQLFDQPFSSICSAFRGKTLREPLHISAVIVNHVILLHPSQSLHACWVHLLIHPSTLVWRWLAWRSTRGPNTSIGIEIPEGGNEGSLAPVCFDKPTSCGPVLGIP